MTSLRTVHEVTDGHLVVDAGARWQDVVAVALQHGLTPPVLTDYLELTGGFDHLEGQAVLDDETGRWHYVLEGATYYSPPCHADEPALLSGLGASWRTPEVEDTTYLEFLDRMRSSEELLRAEGSWSVQRRQHLPGFGARSRRACSVRSCTRSGRGYRRELTTAQGSPAQS